jgi:hypothetical protein
MKRNCHSNGRNLLWYQFLKTAIRLTYRGISLLSTAYKIVSNILLARLTPYVNELIGDHQFAFYVWQILAYDSVKREILYDILLESDIRS